MKKLIGKLMGFKEWEVSGKKTISVYEHFPKTSIASKICQGLTGIFYVPTMYQRVNGRNKAALYISKINPKWDSLTWNNVIPYNHNFEKYKIFNFVSLGSKTISSFYIFERVVDFLVPEHSFWESLTILGVANVISYAYERVKKSKGFDLLAVRDLISSACERAKKKTFRGEIMKHTNHEYLLKKYDYDISKQSRYNNFRSGLHKKTYK